MELGSRVSSKTHLLVKRKIGQSVELVGATRTGNRKVATSAPHAYKIADHEVIGDLPG